MKAVTFAESSHGRPIAKVSPVAARQPSWKRPALRLSTDGAGLAAAIIEERVESPPYTTGTRRGARG